MLASRRAASHGASFFFSGRRSRRAERSFAARVSAEISAETRGERHETFSKTFSTNPPAQPPSDPSAFLRSLDTLGGKHALFGRWLAHRVANAGRRDANEKNAFYVHPALVARRAPGAGVGVFAENAISPGHVLFRAPSFLFESLSAAHAEAVARRRVPAFVERCERACAELGAPAFAPHALFALHVLFELGDERSPNFGYLASLPGLLEVEEEGDAFYETSQSEDSHHLSVPLLWDARRVATLRGTPTFANVAARRAFVEALHASLFGANGVGSAAPVPLAKFKWALSTILSRATSGARAPYALAPGVDLFNHGGTDATCALHALQASSTFSSHRIEKGPSSPASHADDGAYASLSVACFAGAPRDAQLTISYGDAADNDRLLRVYGFAVSRNPNDRSELRMRIEGAALERWRAFERFGPGVLFARRAVLRRHGLPRLAPFEETENAADALFDDVAKAAERALGGGGKLKFRDPGDFQSALGETKETTTLQGDATAATRSSPASAPDVAPASFDDGGDNASQKNEGEPEPILWKCFVAHPAAAPFPARTPAPMDSASPEAARACDAATAAARGVGGGAVSADALLASVRAHLLNGTEPPGPDGHEPDPWAPVSETNEAATRAVVGEAAYAAMRAHVESLQPNADADENKEKERRETMPESRGLNPFAAPSADSAAALSPAAAARARLDLAGDEAWARSALALRRGQEEILEHVLGKSTGSI
jgi:histone-lysine N-methyltransferase SETD3